MSKILVYGSNGFIGNKLINILKEKSINYIASNVRLENYGDIGKELHELKPSHVILAAGLTGKPNVDWCEDHKKEVLRVNVIGTSVLADECFKRNIHLTYFGSGCIYEYNEEHRLYKKDDFEFLIGYYEDDEPNFDKSFYSKTKIIIEKILKNYNNILILRLRMPISDELSPKNFITKIINYKKVINIPNSMTILYELLPISIDMLLKNKVGIYNFTNPGRISHNEILELYKQYIDPNFTWKNFTIKEQNKILKANRSNNFLETDKLCKEYNVDDINIGIKKLFERMKNNLNNKLV